MFNRPSEARAVLQTHLLLNNSLGHPFVQISFEYLHSETVRARELKFFHKSCVTCQISHHYYFVLQSCEACRLRVQNQQGLPCLVNRPSGAGAVLQTPPSLIQSVIH